MLPNWLEAFPLGLSLVNVIISNSRELPNKEPVGLCS
jgi:hypothetical protein